MSGEGEGRPCHHKGVGRRRVPTAAAAALLRRPTRRTAGAALCGWQKVTFLSPPSPLLLHVCELNLVEPWTTATPHCQRQGKARQARQGSRQGKTNMKEDAVAARCKVLELLLGEYLVAKSRGECLRMSHRGQAVSERTEALRRRSAAPAQEARAHIAAASHHDRRCTAAPPQVTHPAGHPYAGAGARCMAATLGGEKHPPGRVASACGAGSDESEAGADRYKKWLVPGS